MVKPQVSIDRSTFSVTYEASYPVYGESKYAKVQSKVDFFVSQHSTFLFASGFNVAVNMYQSDESQHFGLVLYIHNNGSVFTGTAYDLSPLKVVQRGRNIKIISLAPSFVMTVTSVDGLAAFHLGDRTMVRQTEQRSFVEERLTVPEAVLANARLLIEALRPAKQARKAIA